MRRIITDEQIAQFLELCQTLPTRAAADKAGICYPTAYQIAHRHNVFKETKRPGAKLKNISDQALTDARDFVVSGGTIVEAAARLGVCITTLKRRCEQAGVPLPVRELKGGREDYLQANIPSTHRRCRKCLRIRVLEQFATQYICIHCAK